MAESALVDVDIRDGEQLLSLLQRSGVDIAGAFWFYYSERDQWKLVIATPEALDGVRDLYLRAIRSQPDLDLGLVEFVVPSSPVFRAVSGLVPGDDKPSVRISKSVYDGVYIDDALVYRLAA